MTGEIRSKIDHLLQGKIPERFAVETGDTETAGLQYSMNRLIDFVREIQDFVYPLSKGNLNRTPQVSRDNYLASPFKELHSRLLHLTWQAGQVAKGDFSQRVDFMGEFSEAFNSMVVCLEQKEQALQQKINELEEAAAHIRKLEGILPICSNCKRIRLDGTASKDKEGWVILEKFIEDRSEARFTHSICPECMDKLYPEFRKMKSSRDENRIE